MMRHQRGQLTHSVDILAGDVGDHRGAQPVDHMAHSWTSFADQGAHAPGRPVNKNDVARSFN